MLAPVPMIGAIVALLLFVDLAALQFLSNQPHPDQDFSTDGEQVYVLMPGNSPAADGLTQGKVRAFEIRAGDTSLRLSPEDLIEEPDVFPDKGALRSFFERQSIIFDILQTDGAEIVTDQGTVPLTFHVERLPTRLILWIQMIVANVGVLVGMSVWTFQRSNAAARHFAVTGLGLAISSMAASIYSSRPLALDGMEFSMLSYLNFAGTLTFCAGFFCMMLNYPKPLFKFPVAYLWYPLLLLFLLVDYLGLIESLDITRRLPAIATLLLAGGALFLQWRRSRGDPLTRQSLLWFVAVTLSGSVFFIAVIFIPPLIGEDTAVSQGLAFLAFLTIYVGLAVGVARYPLFDLDDRGIDGDYPESFHCCLVWPV